jgi:HAD superfamily hydrolase (TIGR01662 family)
MNYDLIIFDLDGTLVETKNGAIFRKSEDDWKWIPGVLEMVRGLKREGIKIAIASNQGGVAFGFLQWPALKQEILKVASDIGTPYVYFEFSHPNGNVPDFTYESSRRKPGPDMFLQAMQDAHVGPEHTLAVGDREEDEQAAERAGVDFIWAHEFFSEEVEW